MDADFGAVHWWMLVSAMICILTAVGGQLFGCTPTMLASGYSEYVCNENEEMMFFFNNGFQCAIWGILSTATVLLKPQKNAMMLIFSPFLLLAAALIVYSYQHPISSSTQDTSFWLIVTTVVWFGLLGVAYQAHKEPEPRSSMF